MSGWPVLINPFLFSASKDGGGWCEIEGIHHEIHPGEVIVIPPEHPHSYGADEQHPWTIYWKHVKGDSNPLLLAEMGISRVKTDSLPR